MITDPIVLIRQITKSYTLGNVTSTVLNNISLEIDAGDCLAIVGASGSGKSTLMHIIGLLDTFDSGSYFLSGQSVHSLSEDERARIRNQKIGFIFQQFYLLSRLSALQNVMLPLSYRYGNSTIDARDEAMHCLDKVGMIDYFAHHPNQLSGGQQQRVAIARALVTNPEIILADEPTGALDSKNSIAIMDLFLKLNLEGRTLVLVTHDAEIANQCSKKISLADGEICNGEER